MKVVVTGASGFIGHNVLLRAPRDWDVFAVYRSTSGLEAFAQQHGLANVTPVKCDLLNEAEVKALAQDDRRQAGRDAVSRRERRSGGVGRTAALGSRIQHGRVREHARTLPGGARRLRVVRRGLRRPARRGDAGHAGVTEAAVRDLEAGRRSSTCSSSASGAAASTATSTSASSAPTGRTKRPARSPPSGCRRWPVASASS